MENTKTQKTKKKKLRIIESPKLNTNNKTVKIPKKRKLNIIESNKPDEIDIKIMAEKKQMSVRLNETYIGLMEELADIMMKQGEPFRARAYKKAQETIMTYSGDITTPEQLKGYPNIGPTIMEKLKEFQETGTLKILERERTNPENILADIYGIGPKKAKELVSQGITSIEMLRSNQDKLNDTQKVGLKYYEDILKRLPRTEIDKYAHIFNTEFNKVATPDSRFEIVGSYRRGLESSGDIDVIITSNQPQVFTNFINELIAQKIIIEVLSRGPTKSLVITKIPSYDVFRRVDFLYTTPEEYPFSVLYFTGSKMFNTVMRGHALKQGLTMNEHGLYKIDNKKKGEKVSHVFRDEQDIFDYLHLQYKPPKERIDGRAINLNSNQDSINKPIKVVPEDKIVPKKRAYTLKKREKKEIVDTKEDVVTQAKTQFRINPNIKLIMDDFKGNGITVLDQLNENQLATILQELNDAYYNEQPLLTDNEYDIVKEYIEHKYPSNQVLQDVGAPVERNKVKLPYEMWSMDKIKPDTNALTNWMAKYSGPYVLSCKLDGVSGLYTTEHKEPKLYTRGNGKIGQDISHLIPYLRLPKTKNIVIRGEFIIPKGVFLFKYKTTFANPRNMVSGIVNQKSITDAVKDINFVAYEVIKPELKPSAQMDLLKTLDVECVFYKIESTLSNEILSDTLINLRSNYRYEIDGIIVTDDKLHPRQSGNPEHAFAFKMVLSDQVAEAKVVDVIWTPSKDGYLKPRVRIEPIQLGGVQIEYATGFNGAFIENNKIGIGALIELIRSGDVIPYIRKVVVPAEQAKMPAVPYKWNDTHVDIMLENIGDDETVQEKNITGFFRGIGVEGLSSGNVSRIIKAGYDTVPKIIKMTVDDFLKVDGFKMKTATKLYNGVQEKIQSAPLIKLMSGSNTFGRGFSEKKLELILASYPDVLLSPLSPDDKIKKVSAIKGMATKTSETFVEHIPDFIRFMRDSNLEHRINESTSIALVKANYDTNHPLYGKSIVMTGFRDTELIELIKNVGAKLGSSISKNTFVLLVKDLHAEQDTGKALEAKQLGIPIMTKDTFIKHYIQNIHDVS
jgi:NAD-dependent DNA ligase/DNA polymerase/3'-5' exonuclease PolX